MALGLVIDFWTETLHLLRVIEEVVALFFFDRRACRLLRVEIDRGSQPLYPIFDETLGLLYVAGKVRARDRNASKA